MSEREGVETGGFGTRMIELQEELEHKRNELKELKAVLDEQAKMLLTLNNERERAERQREIEFNAKLRVQGQVARLQDEISLLRKSHGGLDHAWIDLANRTREFDRRKENHLANRKDAMQASIYATLIRIRTEAEYFEDGSPPVVSDFAEGCEADFALAKKATDTYWRLKGED